MDNKPTYVKPGPLEIPEGIYCIVKDLIDAHDDKRIVSIQTKVTNPKGPEDKLRKIEMMLLERK